ncbi:hypothetical protein C9374_006542 [Naegleria lovaniensis]|uniref:F-box domain-containing protein n=1 Tax=Naegleria lovaniensis TaxID=51637 RepID=A0AA88GMA4_NAELO|nr:uncharacterized protein C9374_006542 [Naegleria lovaniensis]KAG2379425.1 hypothetical protein C9374_006542 [Naegleria lovaniensis]
MATPPLTMDDHETDASSFSYVPSCFPDDICFHIMLFLELNSIKHCVLISKQWNLMARKIPISVDMSYKIEKLEHCLKLLSRSKLHWNMTSLDLTKNSLDTNSSVWIEIFMNSHYISSLKQLNLNYNYDMGDPCFTMIAKSTKFQNLQVLKASTCGITDFSVQVLAQNAAMSNLRELYLNRNDITESGVKALSTSTIMSQLQVLDLYCKRIGPNGAQHLALAPFKLRELHLLACEIQDDGAIAIGKSPQMCNLTLLDLQANSIETVGASALLGSEYMKNLTSLNLSENKLGKSIGMIIASNLSNLTYLHLGDSKIGEEGAISIVSSPNMSNLTFLSLCHNSLGADFASTLASSVHISKLQKLDLYYNNLGDSGATSLASSAYLKSLTFLDLAYNTIGNEGVLSIALSRNLPSLKRLILANNNFTYTGEDALKQSRYAAFTLMDELY